MTGHLVWYPTSMVVTLTPELEELVREKVESGLYRDEAEVVAEALLLLDRLSQRYAGSDASLRDAIQRGIDDYEAGRYTVVHNPEELESFFGDL